MRIRKSYEGTLNGKKGIWTDVKPKGLTLEKEILFLSAEKDYVLENKLTKQQTSVVIITDESEKNNWDEIYLPKKTPEELLEEYRNEQRSNTK